MRHLIRQLNEAVGRKYYVLVGKAGKGGDWEVIFGDYDRSTVEDEQADARTSGGDPDINYKKLRILTVPNAKQATIDAAVAELREDQAIDRPVVEAEDPWEKAAGMIESGDAVVKILQADLERVRTGMERAQGQLKNLRKGGVGVTEAISLVNMMVLPPVKKLHQDVAMALEELEKVAATKRNA